MIEWQNAANIKQTRTRVCLYGPTRSGKTHICASFPRPVFIFPVNEGSKEVIRGTDCPLVEVASMAQMTEALETLLAAQRSGKLRDWGETICVENLAHYSEIVEMELTRGGVSDMTGQWGKYTAHFTRMREILWSLDAHVVLTALPKVRTNKQGAVLSAGIKMFGQVAELMVASCDIVAYCEQTNGISGPAWVTHVQQYGPFTGGTRIRGMQNTSYPNFTFGEHIAPHL